MGKNNKMFKLEECPIARLDLMIQVFLDYSAYLHMKRRKVGPSLMEMAREDLQMVHGCTVIDRL